MTDIRAFDRPRAAPCAQVSCRRYLNGRQAARGRLDLTVLALRQEKHWVYDFQLTEKRKRSLVPLDRSDRVLTAEGAWR